MPPLKGWHFTKNLLFLRLLLAWILSAVASTLVNDHVFTPFATGYLQKLPPVIDGEASNFWVQKQGAKVGTASGHSRTKGKLKWLDRTANPKILERHAKNVFNLKGLEPGRAPNRKVFKRRDAASQPA